MWPHRAQEPTSPTLESWRVMPQATPHPRPIAHAPAGHHSSLLWHAPAGPLRRAVAKIARPGNPQRAPRLPTVSTELFVADAGWYDGVSCPSIILMQLHFDLPSVAACIVLDCDCVGVVVVPALRRMDGPGASTVEWDSRPLSVLRALKCWQAKHRTVSFHLSISAG